MDSMDLEKEKGITISAKNAAFRWNRNMISDRGQARACGLWGPRSSGRTVDGALLVVDAHVMVLYTNEIRSAQGNENGL